MWNRREHAAAKVTATPNGRLEGLDALRGLAILLVVVGHYFPGRVIAGGVAEAIVQPCAAGGVVLFLLLSGFLIERNLNRNSDLGHYVIHRLFRIFPAYWVAIAVLVLVDRMFIGASNFGTAGQIAANAFLVTDLAKAALISGVFWTLLIETRFYVLAPFLVRAGRVAIVAAPLVVIALNCGILAWRGEASNLLTYVACCLIGMNFSLWHRGELPGWIVFGQSSLLAASLGLFSPYYKVGLAIFGLAGAAALALALYTERAPRFLAWIGAVSYSWYLYHAGIGYPLMAWLEGRAWELPAVVSTAIGVTVTLAMAWISFRLIEQPGIALGHGLAKRLTAQRALVPAAERNR